MHKSPEQFAADLAAEQRLSDSTLDSALVSGREPSGLAADRALRDELRALGGEPALPGELREKILRTADQRPHAGAKSRWASGPCG